MGLDQATVVAFHESGFAVLPDAVDQGLIDRLRARAASLVDGFDPNAHRSVFSTRDQTRTSDDYFLGSGNEVRFFFEERAFDEDGQLVADRHRAINKMGHALHRREAPFMELSRTLPIDAMATQLGHADPLQIQSMYIFKQPLIGGEVGLHQDATFLYTEPLSVVGFWIALEDANAENGCLWALPGGHRLGLKQRFVRANGGTRMLELDRDPIPDHGLVPLEVAAGTLVLLHGLLPHRSDTNRSPRSREAYSVHVVDRAAYYPDDNWLRYAD